MNIVEKIIDAYEKFQLLLVNKSELKREIIEVNKKYQLIVQLINTESKNKGLIEFKKVLYDDYLKFANKEKSLSQEADALLNLQAIEKELEIISAYPNLYKKNIIAVCGGYSTGKSEFVSSFFTEDIALPIGIEPTTAIPTYVVNSVYHKVIGCSFKGGVVNLNKIDKNFYKKLSHEFIKSFGFNLKELMPMMVYATKFKNFENICFIDTPGYNPSGAGFTREDINISRKFFENANAVLWLIGLDAGGTIPATDLNFIQEINFEDKKLFFILNKADLRSIDDLNEILDEVEEILFDEDIECEGISAFSSIQHTEFVYRKKSLFTFLEEQNKIVNTQINKIINKIEEVYLMYKKALIKDLKANELLKEQNKSLLLDLLEMGIEDNESVIFKRINYVENEILEKLFSSEKILKSIKTLDEVFDKFTDSISKIFSTKITINKDKVNETNINLTIKKPTKFGATKVLYRRRKN